ncbi:adenylate cyclase [Novimethylophilus kurashikiensis]|uniref:Adenylate cyclase n=1 Tax=Novimethylophilus kurashikiensis TaxID=1825523 RepID=A0A2R5F3T3_9PROT|nr:adenylate/guanylate cyclase domain-containing protein [Novimethylophilus kurashikiensis]GBG13126.1 adenylate cyclase [Novimethylophilus kurashikiensis]
MLTSLDIIKATGISRATLNNYIALGLLPRPVVASPGDDAQTRARQIGHFPENTLSRIERIKQLKKDGVAMHDIAHQLQLEGFEMSQNQAIETPQSQSKAAEVRSLPETGPLRLTIDQVPYPAYMVNYNLEINWYNEEARAMLLSNFDKLPADTKERSVLEFFNRGSYGSQLQNREAFAQLHMQMGRERVASVLGNASLGVTGTLAGVNGASSSPIAELPLQLKGTDGKDEYYRVYASYFREGILVIFAHEGAGANGLLGLLERRDEVIRNLLKRRLPVLTDVAVMVADLQNSVRICSELPPEEYFELINQIWATMDPIFRRYYGTHGKHVGDGMVYYFFPQPDCNYIVNALNCALEMREAMRRISKEWQLRKNWLNELFLNTGLNEGHEWLGVFHAETKVEFTVLGDTINHAARLSDFARHGSIWATKNLLGKLSVEERSKVRFGIKRQDRDGREVFVNASYSRLSELIDLTSPRYEKLVDIAALAITEIVEVGE